MRLLVVVFWAFSSCFGQLPPPPPAINANQANDCIDRCVRDYNAQTPGSNYVLTGLCTTFSSAIDCLRGCGAYEYQINQCYGQTSGQNQQNQGFGSNQGQFNSQNQGFNSNNGNFGNGQPNNFGSGQPNNFGSGQNSGTFGGQTFGGQQQQGGSFGGNSNSGGFGGNNDGFGNTGIFSSGQGANASNFGRGQGAINFGGNFPVTPGPLTNNWGPSGGSGANFNSNSFTNQATTGSFGSFGNSATGNFNTATTTNGNGGGAPFLSGTGQFAANNPIGNSNNNFNGQNQQSSSQSFQCATQCLRQYATPQEAQSGNVVGLCNIYPNLAGCFNGCNLPQVTQACLQSNQQGFNGQQTQQQWNGQPNQQTQWGQQQQQQQWTSTTWRPTTNTPWYYGGTGAGAIIRPTILSLAAMLILGLLCS